MEENHNRSLMFHFDSSRSIIRCDKSRIDSLFILFKVINGWKIIKVRFLIMSKNWIVNFKEEFFSIFCFLRRWFMPLHTKLFLWVLSNVTMVHFFKVWVIFNFIVTPYKHFWRIKCNERMEQRLEKLTSFFTKFCFLVQETLENNSLYFFFIVKNLISTKQDWVF